MLGQVLKNTRALLGNLLLALGMRQEISLHSPLPVVEYGMTDDNHTLYYTLDSTEADIWLLDLQ